MEKSCTIQDVFERFYPSYEKRNSPPAHHRKTAYHIMNCKTGAFGVNISVFVRTADVSAFIITPAEADAVPCVRSFRKRNGLMHKKRTYLMHPIIM